MSKHYLVTGGTGFIGSALVRRLLRDGHRVRVLDDDSRGSSGRLADVMDDIELARADVRDGDAVREAARGVDAVCHLAFVNGTEFFYSKPELVLDVGVRGMLNVLDACLAEGVGELVLASSSEVYQTPPVIPTDEGVPLSVPDVLNPRYSYGGAKIISELLAINYGRNHLERVLIFRPHNVYGPDMGWEHVIPQFALRMHRLCQEDDADPLPFPIQGSPETVRTFVHIDDFTDGLRIVMDRGEHLGIYHIGTMEERTIGEVAHLVAEHLGRAIEVVPGAPAAGGTLRRCPDTSRLAALGYAPRRSFRDGVQETVAWYVKNADRAPASKPVASSPRS